MTFHWLKQLDALSDKNSILSFDVVAMSTIQIMLQKITKQLHRRKILKQALSTKHLQTWMQTE